MALTEPKFWMVSIFFVIVIALSLSYYGNSLKTLESIELDEDSQEYISSFEKYTQDADFDSAVNTENATGENNVTGTNPLFSVGQLPIISDFLGFANFIADKVQAVWNFLSFVYNLPTFFAKSFGADMDAYNHVLNVLIYLISISIVIIMVRFVK